MTASRLPEGMEDTAELTFHFARAGARAELVVWDDPHVLWESYDHLVLHSPWDYSDRPKEFAWRLSRFEGDFLASAAGSPTLMEVELAQPDLFLRYAEQAYPRLVDLVLGESVTGGQGQAPR